MTSTEYRAARHRFGLTQAQWAAALGVGREYIAKLETGTAVGSATINLLIEAYTRHGLPQRFIPKPKT